MNINKQYKITLHLSEKNPQGILMPKGNRCKIAEIKDQQNESYAALDSCQIRTK